MTFNPIAAQNVLECRNYIFDPNPEALDLGSKQLLLMVCLCQTSS